jgi:hypothetical protein
MRGAIHRLDASGKPRTWIPASAGMTPGEEMDRAYVFHSKGETR